MVYNKLSQLKSIKLVYIYLPSILLYNHSKPSDIPVLNRDTTGQAGSVEFPFIIKSGVFILLYSIGKLILNMFMKQNLNKQQHSFLVTENILYIIIIGYLLSFIFLNYSQ